VVAASAVVRPVRRALCAVVAVALGLICVVVAVTALMAPMGQMNMSATDMALMNSTTGTTVAEVATTAAMPVASMSRQMMATLCGGTCTDEVGMLCGGVVALTSLTLLALLLGSRRDTYLGLLPRPHRLAFVRPGSTEPSPWIPLSPVALCVLRI